MKTYIPSITGLRGISVLGVLAYHAKSNYFSGGLFGVDIFFVISGYLIGKIIIEEIKNENFSLKIFYEKRIRRIIPALLFCIAFCYILIFFLYLPNDIYEFQQSVPWVISFTSNLFFWKTTDYFSSDISIKPLAHTWSLGIEEQFYFLLPIFLILFKKTKIRKLFILLIVMLSFLYGFQNYYYHLPFGCPNANCIATTNFYWLHTRVWELLVGVFINFINLTKQKNFKASFIGLFMILYSFTNYSSSFNHPGIVTLLPVIGTSLLILNNSDKNFINNLLSKGVIYNLGKISYSLYLFHYPIFALVSYFYLELNFPVFGNLTYFFATFLSIFLAYISYKFVEQPFRNRNFFKFKNLILFLIFVSTVLIYFSQVPIYGLNQISEKFIIQTTTDGKDNTKCMIERPDEKFDFDYCTEDYDINFYNILVIGDSTSQNTYFGIKENLPLDFSVSYLGVTGCLPLFTEYYYEQENYDENKCIRNYNNLINFVNSKNFDLVVLSYNYNNLAALNSILTLDQPTDLLLFESLRKINSQEILLMGNPITWKDSLPRYVSRNNIFNNEINQYNSTFLVDNLFETEEKIKILSEEYGFNYLSTIDNFCTDKKCPLYFQDSKNYYLTSVDSLHFSRNASKKYGKLIFEYINLTKKFNY